MAKTAERKEANSHGGEHLGNTETRKLIEKLHRSTAFRDFSKRYEPKNGPGGKIVSPTEDDQSSDGSNSDLGLQRFMRRLEKHLLSRR